MEDMIVHLQDTFLQVLNVVLFLLEEEGQDLLLLVLDHVHHEEVQEELLHHLDFDIVLHKEEECERTIPSLTNVQLVAYLLEIFLTITKQNMWERFLPTVGRLRVSPWGLIEKQDNPKVMRL